MSLSSLLPKGEGESLAILLSAKKGPAKRPGTKVESDWGCRFRAARRRELASLRWATACSQKRTLTRMLNKFFILIKDYPENKSKDHRQTVEK
jgi:hypothetical protein